MTNTNRAKQFLKSYKKSKVQLQHLENQIEELKSILGITGIKYDDVKVKSSQGTDTGDKIIILSKLKQEADEMQASAVARLNEVYNTIGQLKNPEQIRVLSERYITGKTFPQIAEAMLYSERGVHKIHSQGLIEVEKILES